MSKRKEGEGIERNSEGMESKTMYRQSDEDEGTGGERREGCERGGERDRWRKERGEGQVEKREEGWGWRGEKDVMGRRDGGGWK